MPAFVALLRGMNVGSARRVPMAALRALSGDLGHTGVVTLLNSGNAIFRAEKGTPAALAAEISTAIASTLKVDVPVVVKAAAELSAIVTENALAKDMRDHSRLLVAFVQDPKALPGLATIESLVAPPEQFLPGNGAAYLYCSRGILQSKAGTALLAKAGRAAATRNCATVLKLQALASAPHA